MPAGVLAAHEADLLVEHVLPVSGALPEERLVAAAEGLAELRRAPVVEAALERAAHALAANPVARIVAVAVVEVPILLDLAPPERIRVQHGKRVRDSLEGEVHVEAAEALLVGVHDHGDGMVADHAVRLPAEVRDHGEETERPVVPEH